MASLTGASQDDPAGTSMTTYVYQTLPANDDQQPRRYEIQQRMSDAPLTRHPETGEPIRRVILGGYGPIISQSSGSGGGDCGPRCGCC